MSLLLAAMPQNFFSNCLFGDYFWEGRILIKIYLSSIPIACGNAAMKPTFVSLWGR